MGGKANAEIERSCFSAADWHYGPAMVNTISEVS